MTPAPLAAAPTAGPKAQATAEVRGPVTARALTNALSTLRSGPRLAIRQSAAGWTLVDHTTGRLVPDIDPEGLVSAATDIALDGARAGTQVTRDAAGAAIVTQSRTSLGATVTVISPGQLGPRGLHVLTFDNDDVHISDDRGELIFARRTDADGTVSERVGAACGCGCERVIDTSGVTVTLPLR